MIVVTIVIYNFVFYCVNDGFAGCVMSGGALPSCFSRAWIVIVFAERSIINFQYHISTVAYVVFC